MHVESISENKQVLRLVANGDPKMKLPGWLINQCIKLIILVFLNQIASKAENLPDEYRQLIEEKVDFYGAAQTKLDRIKR